MHGGTPHAIIQWMSRGREKHFWSDLYPAAETRRRLSRSSWVWIYLPIAASILAAAGAAVAVFGVLPDGGFEHPAHLATIILAAGLLAAGFVFWLAILICLWGINETLEVLPTLTSRLRWRSILIARSWKRGIHSIRRTAAAVLGFFFPERYQARNPWTPPRGRRGKRARRE